MKKAAVKLSPEQERELVASYLAQEPMKELRAKFGVVSGTIYNVLKRHNVKPHTPKKRNPKLRRVTQSQKDHICKLYQEGKSCLAIGSDLGISWATARRVLRNRGITLRTYSEASAKAKLTPEQVKEVISRYEAGENTYQIAERLGMHNASIWFQLERHGIRRRDRLKFTAPEEKSICELYKSGKSADDIGTELESHPNTIRGILKRNGVELRSQAEAQQLAAPKQVATVRGKHPLLIDGYSTKAHRQASRTKAYMEWRKAVIKRCGSECCWCGEQEDLQIHHILPKVRHLHLFFEVGNGIVLCRDCHKSVQGQEEDYADLFFTLNELGQYA